MSKAKKNIAVVFGPKSMSAKQKQAMINFQKKQIAKHAAAAKAKEAEERALAAKTKGMGVKDLRKAILLGLSIREAAHVGLKAFESLDIIRQSGEGPDLDYMERLIRHLLEKDDHTIKFVAEDEEDGRGTWIIRLEPDDPWNLALHYDTFHIDYPESSSESDEGVLNKFILDFYGIKEHAVDSERRVSEIRGEIARLEVELKIVRERMKDLKSELSRRLHKI